jgi:4-hydroxy-3-methylbut-2-enyl diphosphate reductase
MEKLKVRIADKSGFCFGVRRAVDLAQKVAAKYKKAYTLGPIIHNPQEVKRLSKLGIKTIKSFKSIKDGLIILRTHGIPLSLYEQLKKKKGIETIDAVCPFVKKAQNIVEELSEKKEMIIIVGEKAHPEVKALISYGGKNCIVIENIEDARKIKIKMPINIVSQTTQTQKNFNEIVRYLKRYNKVRIFNTICKATLDRQKSAYKLAKNVDLMIVVGGKNSGNSTRLSQICKSLIKTYHIETADDIKRSWFKGAKKVGITAGASTPDWIIAGVKKKIEEKEND